MSRQPSVLKLRPTDPPLPRITSVVQAKQLQRLAHQQAMSLHENLKRCRSIKSRLLLSRAIREAVSAWDTARDAVRILKGKGLPRSEPEKRLPSKFKHTAFQVLDIEPETRLAPKALPAPEPQTEKPATTEGSRPV